MNYLVLNWTIEPSHIVLDKLKMENKIRNKTAIESIFKQKVD